MTQMKVADIVVADDSGFACSKTKLVTAGLIHLRPFNIGDGNRLDMAQVFQIPESEAAVGRRELLPGDILFNNTNSAELVGKSALIEQRILAGYSNHLTRIRLDTSLVEPAYFSYWLRKLRSTGYFTLQATQWVSQAAYKSSDLRKLSIDLPPLAEQRRVVDILALADGIVRLRRDAQQKAAELVPAIFLGMFGDPATNPKNLPMRRIADFVAKFAGGKNIQAGSEVVGGHRILKVSAVTSGSYIEAKSKPSPDNYVPPQDHIVREGDMLFSRANTVDLVGATAIVEATNGTTLLPDKLWRFVWADEVDVRYVHALFQTASVRKALSKLATGTSDSMRNISQAKLLTLQLPIATLDQQKKFGALSEPLRSINAHQAASIAIAEATYRALLFKYFPT